MWTSLSKHSTADKWKSIISTHAYAICQVEYKFLVSFCVRNDRILRKNSEKGNRIILSSKMIKQIK